MKILATVPVRKVLKNYIAEFKNNAITYSVDADRFYGQQLSLREHTHAQYVEKVPYMKEDTNWYTDLSGYYYEYAQRVGGYAQFATWDHNHDSRYVFSGDDVELTHNLGGYTVEDFAAIQHSHLQYLYKTTIFSNANFLENYTKEFFATADHNHDTTYYSKTDTVSNSKYIYTLVDGEVVYLTDEELAPKIHYHSAYISATEALKVFIMAKDINSALLNNRTEVKSAKYIISANSALDTVGFSNQRVTWQTAAEAAEGNLLPAQFNANLVKLSSYKMHVGLTPPTVSTIDIKTQLSNFFARLDRIEDLKYNRVTYNIAEIFVAPGRVTFFKIKSDSSIPPMIIPLSQAPIIQGDSEKVYLAESCYFNLTFETDSTSTYWLLSIYQYNLGADIIQSNQIRVLIIHG